MVSADPKTKIIEYIKKNLKKGYTEESLKWALINQGYSRILVEDAFVQTHKTLAKTAPLLKEKPVIKYEVFDEYDRKIDVKKPFWKKFFKK